VHLNNITTNQVAISHTRQPNQAEMWRWEIRLVKTNLNSMIWGFWTDKHLGELPGALLGQLGIRDGCGDKSYDDTYAWMPSTGRPYSIAILPHHS